VAPKHTTVSPNPMKAFPQQGLVVFAKNKKRVAEFYQRALGLRVRESTRSYDLLRGIGYEVIIHAIPKKHAARLKLSRPPADSAR
jgi:catechol-2,3-dioxygenase